MPPVGTHSRFSQFPTVSSVTDLLNAPFGRHLDVRTRAKLLAATHRMVPMTCLASTLIPLLTLFAFWNVVPSGPLLAWCGAMVALSAGCFGCYLGYRRERSRVALPQHTARWWPRMRLMAFITGVAWACAALLHAYSDSSVFNTMLFAMTLGVLAVAASSHAPIPSNLVLFALPVLVSLFVLAAVAFPGKAAYVWSLVLAYAGLLGYHALNIHRTLCREIALERGSRRLARRFYQERERALQASDEKSRFLAAASHDLRQPVHALVMLVEALRARNRSDDLHPLVEQVAAGTQTIDLLFRSLLDLSKLEGRKQLPELEPCNVSELIQEVIWQSECDARINGLTLRGPLTAPLHVMAEPVLLRRALFNLMQNAMRYTPRGGVIVRTRARGREVRIEVWDTGVGIDRAHLAEIFTPYFQVGNPQRDLSQGLGLGLAIFRECVRLMRGRYGVRSISGRGSVFWFALPLAPAAMLADARLGRDKDGADVPAFGGTILVVDDDRQVREAWSALLKAWGIAVHCVDDGAGADAALTGGLCPDVILCDLRLPGLENGLQLMERLHAAHPASHVALLSGDPRSQAFLDAEEAGYVVLSKPVDMDALRVLLRRWLPQADAVQAMRQPVRLSGESAPAAT